MQKYFKEKKAAGDASPRATQHELGVVDTGCSGLCNCTHGGDRRQHIKWLGEYQDAYDATKSQCFKINLIIVRSQLLCHTRPAESYTFLTQRTQR